MKSRKRGIVTLLTLFIIAMITTVAALRGQSNNQNNPPRNKQQSFDKQEYNSQFPIADYDAPEPTDPKERDQRRARSKHHDRMNMVTNDSAGHIAESALYIPWGFDIGALPAGKSDAIVIGNVLDAAAHLSNDKTGVYSEFTVQVNEVLKSNGSVLPVSGSSITVERPGGFVRYGSGHQRLFHIAGQNMPRVGRRYVLFLNNTEQPQDYSLLTGYELGQNGVAPLDDSDLMEPYRGTNEANFLKAVRDAIAQSSQVKPKQ